MSETIVKHRQNGWFEAYWRNVVLLHHYRGMPSDEHIVACVRSLTAYAIEHSPLDFALVVQGRPPSASSRRLVKGMLKTQARHFRSVTVWICADGLVASVARSVATGIFMLGAAIPTSFISERAELVSLLKRHGTQAEANALVTRVMDVKQPSEDRHVG